MTACDRGRGVKFGPKSVTFLEWPLNAPFTTTFWLQAVVKVQWDVGGRPFPNSNAWCHVEHGSRDITKGKLYNVRSHNYARGGGKL